MTGSTTRYANNRLQPANTLPLAALTVAKLPPLVNLSAGTVLGAITEGTAASAVHTLTFGGTVTGGTFRLQYGAETTAPITWSATAATLVANVQAAVNEIFGAGNATVAGAGPFTVTFSNGLSNLPIPAPVTLSALTGTTPTAAVTVTTPGVQSGTVMNAYASGNSDGTQVARCILAEDISTDIRGRRIGDRPSGREAGNGTPVYTAGPFFVADLVGLDAGAVTAMGRIANATSISAPGAIFQMR